MLEFLGENKWWIIGGVVLAIAVAGAAYYWFVIRPNQQSAQEQVEAQPAPPQPLPPGTSPIAASQARQRRMGRPKPQINGMSNSRVEVADAVRSRQERAPSPTPSSKKGGGSLEDIFESDSPPAGTEYPPVDIASR